MVLVAPPATVPRSLIVLLAAAITVALQQGALIGRKHAIHLLTARHCMLKFALHMVNVRFKIIQEGEHFLCGLIKAQNLTILLIYCLLRDVANKAKVLLDPVQKVLRAQARQQGQFSLQIDLGRPDKDVELI